MAVCFPWINMSKLTVADNPYGAPPAYGGYPGSNNAPPGMAPPPGLGALT